MKRTRVGILIFDDVEVLDYCGPFEVFSVTRLDEARRLQEPSPFDILLVAETLDPVTTTGGMRVLPDVTFEDCPPWASSWCRVARAPAGSWRTGPCWPS